MIIGKWGPYCKDHMKKSSPGGKGIPTYNEKPLSENEAKFLKDLE